MRKIKIVTILGARPQFIKETMLQNQLKFYDIIDEIVINTGQHYDMNMSEIFLNNFVVNAPKYNLNINQRSNSEMTALMMIDLEKILLVESPDYILVYGDTNSTLAGAIVGRKMNIPVIHVEAGLRQLPREMPEEINRVLTDHASSLYFVPSDVAVENLNKEGIKDNIFVVGDIMRDYYLISEPFFEKDLYIKYNLEKENYFVLTLHRDFNVDNETTLAKILHSLNEISKTKKIIFPIHPRTKSRIDKFGLHNLISNIKLIDPLSYKDLMGLVLDCFKVITDSGGLQKESYYARKEACIIMPDTGWRELIQQGYNSLVDSENIYEIALREPKEITDTTIYGAGTTSKLIIEIIIKDFLTRKKG